MKHSSVICVKALSFLKKINSNFRRVSCRHTLDYVFSDNHFHNDSTIAQWYSAGFKWGRSQVQSPVKDRVIPNQTHYPLRHAGGNTLLYIMYTCTVRYMLTCSSVRYFLSYRMSSILVFSGTESGNIIIILLAKRSLC